MFWNKKDEKKSLPDLPPIKSPFSKELAVSSENANLVEEKLDEAGEDSENEGIEKHSLPSFPDSPINRGFSQVAIKEAIADSSEHEEITEPEESLPLAKKENTKFKILEMDSAENKKENPYLTSIKSDSLMHKRSYVEQTTPYNAPYSQTDQQMIAPPPEEKELEMEIIEKPEARKGGDVFVKIEKFYSAKKSLESIKMQIDQIDDLLKKIRDIKLKEEKELAVWEKEIALVKSRIQNVNDTIFEKIL